MTNAPSLLERLFSLRGKSVFLTGASGGIGQVLAVALAEAGAAIGVHGRDVERINETCTLVEEVGGRAAPPRRGLSRCTSVPLNLWRKYDFLRTGLNSIVATVYSITTLSV